MIRWLKNIVWTDKIMHYVAGHLAFNTLFLFTGNLIVAHSIIFIFNCLWEWKWRKEEKWCWLDWISVELGAISCHLLWLKDWRVSPIGVALMVIYALVQLWYWKVWPFKRK